MAMTYVDVAPPGARRDRRRKHGRESARSASRLLERSRHAGPRKSPWPWAPNTSTLVLDRPTQDRRKTTSPSYGRGISPSLEILLVVGVLVVGAALRLLWLNTVGFNSDEAVYAGQAASIAGHQDLQPFFPIFRAHPLLFQTFLSLFYLHGVSDLVGRLVAVAIGVVTIFVVYRVGRLLYGVPVGLVAGLIFAVMPYPVVVSRQVLLDGTLTLFATLTLLLLAKYATTRQPAWFVVTGAALGLTFLSKEVGILFVAAVFAFLALTPRIGTRTRDVLLALLAFVLVALPYPLSLVFAKSSSTGQSFLAWQLFRRPNHDALFYFSVVPPALGLLVLLIAAVGLWVLRRQGSWRETLLLAWILVPLLFLELWTVKGFQYLLPIAAPVAVLAARGAVLGPRQMNSLKVSSQRVLATVLVIVLVASAGFVSWTRIQPSTTGTFMAGSGGVPGGRQAGEWVAANVPQGAELLAIGPSMANIIQWYGQRKTYGISVSPNPLNRNPTYEPVVNPDLEIRRNQIQYLVWDSYSASRSPFFSKRLTDYAERYHGRAVFTATVPVTSPSGERTEAPVIIIYEVRP